MPPFPSMRWSGMVSKDSITSMAARAASKESHKSATSRKASKDSRKSYFSHTFPDVEIADGTASFPPNRLMHDYHLDNIKHFMKDGSSPASDFIFSTFCRCSSKLASRMHSKKVGICISGASERPHALHQS